MRNVNRPFEFSTKPEEMRYFKHAWNSAKGVWEFTNRESGKYLSPYYWLREPLSEPDSQLYKNIQDGFKYEMSPIFAMSFLEIAWDRFQSRKWNESYAQEYGRFKKSDEPLITGEAAKADKVASKFADEAVANFIRDNF